MCKPGCRHDKRIMIHILTSPFAVLFKKKKKKKSIPNATPPITYANPHGDIERHLKDAWLLAGNAVKSQPQLLVCILPNTGVPLYANIKRVSDTIIGIPTQCVQKSHTMNPKKQYCANVCLKINVKLGGMNSFLSPQQTPFLTERPTILFGADVSHPPPGDNTRPSIASLVGSMDAKAARYAATVRVQTARTETIADLGGMVVELLKTFYQTVSFSPRSLFSLPHWNSDQFFSILLEFYLIFIFSFFLIVRLKTRADSVLSRRCLGGPVCRSTPI